jgi:hypothetical protein
MCGDIMIRCKTRKWGNSIGILIPKHDAKDLNIKEDQEIMIDITKKTNPLRELFGFGKSNKISREEFLEGRELLESKRF